MTLTTTAQGASTERLHDVARQLDMEVSPATKHWTWLKIRKAAAQLRFAASLVEQGTYDQTYADAWAAAGELMLAQLAEARAEAGR